MKDTIQKLKQAIVDKKRQINQIYKEQLFPAKEDLEQLMNEAAKAICPFKIGERVEFENGKQGEIVNITYFSMDFFSYSYNMPPATKHTYEKPETFDPSRTIVIEFEQTEFSFTWQIEGVMIKKDGSPGKRNFVPKNPFENKIEGHKIYERTLINFLENGEFFNIE